MNRGRVKPTSGLYLRAKPNGEPLKILQHNEKFQILDEVKFYRVKTIGGGVGYVHGDYIETIPELITPEDSLDSLNFQLITYQHPRFVGAQARIDIGFKHTLDAIAQYAEQYDVYVWVTSSIRQLNNQIEGAIVKPASNSCHHIGHAIDMNIQYEGVLYNSRRLRKSAHSTLPEPVKSFLEDIHLDSNMRWGGDFSQEDPVHIDDNLFNRDRFTYSAKLSSRIEQLNGTV